MGPKRNGSIALGIREEHVHPGAHIAFLWESDEQFLEALGFLEAGFRASDYGIVFGYGEANMKVIAGLKNKGIDVEALERQGRLAEVGGQPTGEATLAAIGAAFQKMIDHGAQLVRLLGNIGWGRAGWPSEDEILRFEAQVTQAAMDFPCIVVCMYDMKGLSGRIMIHGALETHPLTFCGNVMRQNPYYVPIEQFLGRKEKPG